MPVGYRSRTEYLSLAQFCQDLIESLFDYLDGRETPELDQRLTQALRALEDVRRGDLYRFGQQKSAALGTSEQVSTLRQIWSGPEIDRAIRLIKRLQRPAQSSRRADVQQLVSLFSRLRTKALWNFQQSAPSLITEAFAAI